MNRVCETQLQVGENYHKISGQMVNVVFGGFEPALDVLVDWRPIHPCLVKFNPFQTGLLMEFPHAAWFFFVSGGIYMLATPLYQYWVPHSLKDMNKSTKDIFWTYLCDKICLLRKNHTGHACMLRNWLQVFLQQGFVLFAKGTAVQNTTHLYKMLYVILKFVNLCEGPLRDNCALHEFMNFWR